MRIIRRVGLAFALLAGITWAIGASSHVRAQVAASEIIAQVRSDLLAISSEPGGDQVYYAVIGVPSHVDHAPTYGTFLGRSCSAAFMKKPISLMSIQREYRQGSLRNRMLTNPNHKIPVQILEWVETEGYGGRLKKLSGVLPPPGGPKPRISFSADKKRHDFLDRLRPRDVECFALEFESLAQKPFKAELRFEKDSEEAFVYDIAIDPIKYGSETRRYIEVAENEAWLFSQAFKSVTWTVLEGESPLLTAIDFDTEMPEIQLVETAERSLSEVDPGVRFIDPGGFEWFRIRVFLQDKVKTFTYPRLRFQEIEGGILSIHLDSPGFLPGEDPLPLAILQTMMVNVLDEKGIRGLPLSYRVEALRGSIAPEASAQSRSGIGHVSIER